MATQEQDKKRRAELLSALLAIYLLDKSAQDSFEEVIYTARIDAMDEAISSIVDDLGFDVDSADISDEILSQMADESLASAESIVATYNEDVTNAANNVIDDYLADHGTLDGAESVLRTELNQWTIDREEWKAEQIANVESSTGYSAANDWFAGEYNDGNYNIPEGISSSLMVMVYPTDAAEYMCEDLIAGSPYAIDDADEVLSAFPLHPGCPHFCVLEWQ